VSIPSGTVTFLFTEIEGGTSIKKRFPDEWETLRARHHVILQRAAEALEAAETVVSRTENDRLEVIDILTDLVDKSLVTSNVDGSRYRMLETMHGCAWEKLTGRGIDFGAPGSFGILPQPGRTGRGVSGSGRSSGAA
jgi:hypothetical protein